MLNSTRFPLVALAIVSLVVTVACGQTAPPPEEPAAPGNPLRGVWSMTAVAPGDGSAVIDPSQPGLYIFAEGYYSAVYAPGAEPRVPSANPFEPSADEMVAQHESIIVNTGTYEVSGSTITFRPVIAKSPGFVGGHATSGFAIDGDSLTLTGLTVVGADGTEAPNVTGSTTFRRVE